MNWAQICSPIKSSGLGVRNLIQLNQALLEKWLWQYATNREAPWKLVIEAKYDTKGEDSALRRQQGHLEWEFGNI